MLSSTSLLSPSPATAVPPRPHEATRLVAAEPPAGGSPAVTVTVHVTLPGDAAGDDPVNAAARLAERLHTLAATTATDAGGDVSTSVALLVERSPAVVHPTKPSGPTPHSPRRAFPRAVPPAARRPALRILTDRREAVLAGTPMTLTRREYDLLLFLAGHPGRVFTRPQLLRWVWGHSIISGERTVDVHVRRLRAKLAGRGPTITTVRGIGYRLDDVDRVAVVSREQPGSGVAAGAD
jgi:DNA-binding winged helix-turn-helix (wHTH) protein